MKRKTIAMALVLVMIAAMGVGCVDKEPSSSPSPSPDVVTQTPEAASVPAARNGDFGMAFELLKQVNTPGKNVLVSPYSLDQALGMAKLGAKGETAKQIGDVLGFEGEAVRRSRENADAADERVTVKDANSIWGANDFSFKEDFIAQNKDIFNAETRSVDFNSPEAAKAVNDWVSEATQGEITDIAGDLSGARAVLINALYFHAPWTTPFDKNNTQKQDFYTANSTVSVDMMTNAVSGCLYAEDDNSQRLVLPYGNGSFAMMIILPKEVMPKNGKDIDDYINNFNANILDGLDSRSGDISLPKFKFDAKYDLTATLKNMGIKDAFEDGAADFSGMTDEAIFISGVEQATTIDVFEDGTIAGAATMIMFARGMDIGERFNMVCDRPFLFMIYDTQGNTPLFIGKIYNPLEV